jgi:teichuronic acid exporter
MPSLKQKTISGLTWSFVDDFAQKGITFVIGIILARLILPREFGLIGMLSIFFAISNCFIYSGFSAALIRKQNCTDADYSTVFYFNMAAGILFYLLLFFSAPAISGFFKEPQLTQLLQVLGVVLVIDSLTLIQRTILTKRIDFKLQTKISALSSVSSGVVGILMAYSGYGVWSLVVKQISRHALEFLLFWLWNQWRPLLVFSRQSFLELFLFGYRILFSGLINAIYQNSYLVIIGKFFSSQDLGFFTRANLFKSLPAENLIAIVSRVSYPVLVQMQDDPAALKRNFKVLIKSTMFIAFVLMIGMATIAEPMIILLIGEPWRPSIIFLQMLCFVGMMEPLHELNRNMLIVQGRTDLFLRVDIITKTLVIPVIIIGIFCGIKFMIAAMIIKTQIDYFFNSYWSGKLLDYSMKEQVRDIIPSFFLAAFMGAIVFTLAWFLPSGYFLRLIIQVVVGAAIVFTISEFAKIDAYLYMKEILQSKLDIKK